MKLKRIADTALSVAALLGVLGMLVGVAVVALGVTPLIFRSGSMAPAIDTGDLAFAKHVQIKDIKVGDVVSVRTAGTRVTHRVVGVDAHQLRLKGDANNTADVEPYAVESADRVFAHVPKLGYAIAWAMTPVGLIVSGAVAALLLFLALMPNRSDHSEPGHGAGHSSEDSSSSKSGARRGVTAAAGAAALVVVSTTTLAFWTDQANLSSPVSSGTVTIHAGGTTDYTMPFSGTDLVPGESAAQSLSLSNGGSIPLKWTAEGKGAGGLTTLKVQTYYGSNAAATNGTSNGKRVGSCTGNTGGTFDVTPGGTPSTVVTVPQTLVTGSTGKTKFCVKVTLDDTSNQWTKSASLEFTFNAKQVNAP